MYQKKRDQTTEDIILKTNIYCNITKDCKNIIKEYITISNLLEQAQKYVSEFSDKFLAIKKQILDMIIDTRVKIFASTKKAKEMIMHTDKFASKILKIMNRGKGKDRLQLVISVYRKDHEALIKDVQNVLNGFKIASNGIKKVIQTLEDESGESEKNRSYKTSELLTKTYTSAEITNFLIGKNLFCLYSLVL